MEKKLLNAVFLNDKLLTILNIQQLWLPLLDLHICVHMDTYKHTWTERQTQTKKQTEIEVEG